MKRKFTKTYGILVYCRFEAWILEWKRKSRKIEVHIEIIVMNRTKSRLKDINKKNHITANFEWLKKILAHFFITRNVFDNNDKVWEAIMFQKEYLKAFLSTLECNK